MKVKYRNKVIDLKTILEKGEEELDLNSPNDLEKTVEFTPIKNANIERETKDE